MRGYAAAIARELVAAPAPVGSRDDRAASAASADRAGGASRATRRRSERRRDALARGSGS